MKKMGGLLLILILGLNPCAVADDTVMSGTVLEENPQTVTLALNGSGKLAVGTEIELSYLADMMELLIGRFKVISANGNQYVLGIVGLSTRPSQGMNVKIVPALNLADMILYNSGNTQPATPAVPATPVADAPQGEVIGVFGDDLLIELKTGAAPSVGDIAEVKYMTGSGMAMDVGSWKVTGVNGRQIKATVIRQLTKPQKKLSVFFKASPQGNVVLPSQPPVAAMPGATVYPSVPASATNVPVSGQETITLLGVPAPAATPSTTDTDLFSPTYGQVTTSEVQQKRLEYLKQLSFQQEAEALKQNRNE
ncbi:MAG: hypothetical protein PHN49_11665 [Candidatus Omnitrophica bacterium]|nr:hypothetical protein [Candidatus Omnitrophota bacterium]MDD5672285.1 hypothetical protein [Candidatus Omnitrophota bacterium]